MVCIGDFSAPDMTLHGDQSDFRLLVKAPENYQIEVPLYEQSGPDTIGCGDAYGSRLTMTLVQDGQSATFGKSGKILGTDFPAYLDTDDDSSYIVNSDRNEQSIFHPGKAKIQVGIRYTSVILGEDEINLSFDFPTEEGVRVSNIDISGVDGGANLAMQVKSPVMFGTEADIKLTATTGGETIASKTITRTISGSTSIHSPNTEDVTAFLGLDSYGDIEICAEVVGVRRI